MADFYDKFCSIYQGPPDIVSTIRRSLIHLKKVPYDSRRYDSDAWPVLAHQHEALGVVGQAHKVEQLGYCRDMSSSCGPVGYSRS